MDKMQRHPQRIAPVSVRMGDSVGVEKLPLLRELTGYQARLDEARRIMKRQRRKGHEADIKAQAEKRVDLAAAVQSVMVDYFTDSDYGLIGHWQYVARKLAAAVEVLEVDRDQELAGLRDFVKRIRFD